MADFFYWLTDCLQMTEWLTCQMPALFTTCNYKYNRLADMLSEWLIDELSDSLTDWQTGLLTELLTDWLIYWLTDMEQRYGLGAATQSALNKLCHIVRYESI